MGSKRLTPTSGKNGLKTFVVVVVVVVVDVECCGISQPPAS